MTIITEITGENGPKFEYADTNVAVSINPDSQTAFTGSRVAITCDVKSDVPFTPVITWRNAHANNLPPNHQTIGNQLIFNNVNEEHGGLYQCTVNTPVGTVSAYSSLTVLRNDQDYERGSQPAIETVDVNGGTKTIYTGQSIYLRCRHPENNYHVRIRFESPNDEILSEGYGEVFYLLSEVTPQNSGRYTCVIDDDLSIRLFVYITVEEIAYNPYNPSESTLYIHPKSVYQIKESKVDLNCYGDENVSDYRWFKLSENEAWLPVNLKDVFVIENSLQISNFQPEHAGLYKCTAINRVDGRHLHAFLPLRSVKSFKLKIFTLSDSQELLKPKNYPYLLVSPDHVEMFEGDSVTINCQSSDDFELMYWSREDNKPLPENSSVSNYGRTLVLEVW
ncbi:hypothetical protein HELRODRAFT_158991 [Helobdella robusta]|uniref:Ig-like domain-containing protein n=1 Tax=Helobdella robusta TaxID=6412 RepID=T1ENG6_HELRO|nr:hypothetical protein HELRODRAFT_158991 [Helobdella robusta]ESO12457.1 hypothetical protein HELRODRAFT_158991 [Helobdella robusta]